MKIKTIKFIGSAIIAFFVLTGCESDDAFKFEPYERGVDYHWGYMKGHVYYAQTDEDILVNHEQHPGLLDRQIHRSEYSFYGDPDKRIQYRYMQFFYNDKEAVNNETDSRTEDMLPSSSVINLTLVGGFKEGLVEIVDGENIVRLDNGAAKRNLNSSIAIEIYDEAEKSNYWGVKPLRYVPSEDNPFIVQIDAVEYDNRNFVPPVLEGQLVGILYREDNPEDWIAVNMRFGM